jgi:hypothetical protein
LAAIGKTWENLLKNQMASKFASVLKKLFLPVKVGLRVCTNEWIKITVGLVVL